MGSALLVQYYNDLPEPREDEDPLSWAERFQTGLEHFRKQVSSRYTEGTLQRLLDCPVPEARRAAVLALGMFGTMKVSPALSGRLNDDDPPVRHLAADALWAVWYRGDSDANNQELQRLMAVRDLDQAVSGLDSLVKKAPNFAEAYNQRAIRYFQMGEFEKSAADCEKVLQLNPQHFGAQSGLAQCLLRLRKPRAALKAYREALRLNPNLEGVEETIRALEHALGEEGER